MVNTPLSGALPEPPTGIETPTVFIDLEVVDANIKRMQDSLGNTGVKLRPHMKSHKSVNLARRQLDAGAAGITVSSVGEAEVFAEAGCDDIFIAYTIWAGIPSRAQRIRRLHEQVRSFSIGVDSVAGAQVRLGTCEPRRRRPPGRNNSGEYRC